MVIFRWRKPLFPHWIMKNKKNYFSLATVATNGCPFQQSHKKTMVKAKFCFFNSKRHPLWFYSCSTFISAGIVRRGEILLGRMWRILTLSQFKHSVVYQNLLRFDWVNFKVGSKWTYTVNSSIEHIAFKQCKHSYKWVIFENTFISGT